MGFNFFSRIFRHGADEFAERAAREAGERAAQEAAERATRGAGERPARNAGVKRDADYVAEDAKANLFTRFNVFTRRKADELADTNPALSRLYGGVAWAQSNCKALFATLVGLTIASFQINLLSGGRLYNRLGQSANAAGHGAANIIEPLAPKLAASLREMGPEAAQLGLDIINMPTQAAMDFANGALNKDGRFTQDQMRMGVYMMKGDILAAAAAQQGIDIDPATLVRTMIDADRQGQSQVELAARLQQEHGIPQSVLNAPVPSATQAAPSAATIIRKGANAAGNAVGNARDAVTDIGAGLTGPDGMFGGFLMLLLNFLGALFGLNKPEAATANNAVTAVPAAAPSVTPEPANAGPSPRLSSPSPATTVPAMGAQFRDNAAPAPDSPAQDGLRNSFQMAGVATQTASGNPLQRFIPQAAPQFSYAL